MDQKLFLELVGILGAAMAGYGTMFAFIIRWTTRKNDELIKIMLGNDRVWKERTSECLDNIRDHVDHGECCAYRQDRENIHERLHEIHAACGELGRTSAAGKEGA